MKKRKGFKKIVVNNKSYLMAWSLPIFPHSAGPILTVYTEDGGRFVFKANDFEIPEKPKDRLPTWKGKHGTAGWDTFEANFIISKSGI